MYGNPHNKGAVVNNLDVMILGATEIDVNFNVNVTTDSNGNIMGGSGGHSDTAAGSKLAIVVSQLFKGRLPAIVDEVTTVSTPGETIDVLVTERGIAVNPKRQDLIEKIKKCNIPLVSIEELKASAEEIVGKPESIELDDKITAIVEYRDGTIIDVVRKVKG
jgi:citrate lyase subunit alpha/citrate CoA-transferase